MSDEKPESSVSKNKSSLRDCDRWKMLDKQFKTDVRSPLHHDNRCEDCRKKV